MRSKMSVYDELVTRGNGIVIPEKMRAEILDRIHDGLQGLTKCREANTSLWWPGIVTQIKTKVLSCRLFQEQRRWQCKEPLISTPLPGRE